MLEKGIKKFIGDKEFYSTTAKIVVPVIIQQMFFSLAGYIDSLMINSYSSLSYSGVSAANRLMFIFNFICIGLSATTGIFISQYFGAKKKEGINSTLNLSIICAVIFGVVGFIIFHFFGHAVVDMYIQNPEARYYGYRYLDVMKWGLILIALNMALSSCFRSVKQPLLPLFAAITEIVVNITLNYVLIFGHFGFPKLDSQGAAIATVISRVVSVSILFITALFGKKSYFKEFYKKINIGKDLVKTFTKTGLPIVVNELAFALGNVLFAMFYAYKNDLWYNAYSYAQNISDLFFIFFAALGNGTSVIVGSALGAGDFDRAWRDSFRMKGLGVMLGGGIAIIMAIVAPYAILLFNPDPITKEIAIKVLYFTAALLAFYAYNSVCFFILRAGGDSIRAFVLDQGATFLVGIPIAIVLGVNAASWGLTLPFIFAITHISDVIKFFLGTYFVGTKKWMVNLTENSGEKNAQPAMEG